MDFSKLPSLQPFKLSSPLRQFIVPKAAAEIRWNDAQLDPKIIVHPPQSRLGPDPASHAIPAQWPSFKIEEIPTQWPKFALSLVQSAKQIPPLPPAK
jgi:hypothetical protein